MDSCSYDVAPATENTDLDRLGNEIAELSAHLDAATAHLLHLIREFDVREGWNTGFRSCAAWLSWRVGLDPGAARERVRTARALGNLPRLSQSLARGEISFSKARAVTRVARPETEEQLLAVARAGTAAHVERIVRAWRRVDRVAEARESAGRHKSRALHVYQDEDGMVVVRGRLEPEAGALLMRWRRPARRCISNSAPTIPRRLLIRRARRPRWGSSRLTRWLSWRRPRSTRDLIQVRRASGIRSWFISMPRCLGTRINRVSRCSRMAETFPQKRPSAWRVTRAAW